MPKVDGIEVLSKIKNDEQKRLTPVVVLTSFKEERDVIESYKPRVNDFVVKRVEFEKFVEAALFWLHLNPSPR